MSDILISWIGHADLRAPGDQADVGIGPVAQALDARSFDAAVLISDYPENEVTTFLEWLRLRSRAEITVCHEPLSGPTEFAEIYESAVRVVSETLTDHGKNAGLTFHLSPGTPAMAAVWIILAKTRFPAELIESSAKHGVRTVSVPFDISAEFIPNLLRGPDERLEKATAGLPPETPEFADIIYQSDAMTRVITRARRVAPRSVPVLIQGESGTGKELLARRSTARVSAGITHLWRSTAGRYRPNWRNPNYSVTKRAPSQVRTEPGLDISRQPTMVHCSLTRSANFPRPRR